MIAPQNRLIYWTALVSLAAALLAAVEPTALGPLITTVAAFVLLAVCDALLATRKLRGVGAAFPEVVRMTKDREGELDVEIVCGGRAPGATLERLRLGIALPPEIESPWADMECALAPGTERSRVSWPCTPRRRGRYVIENVYIEADSPLGLWAVRRVAPARTELRVYPNLLGERSQLAALFLNRGTLGIHAQRQVGKGREFEKLREYMPGDSYEDIHWKATAKRCRPVTKVFQIERTQEVYVVIDASRLSAREVQAPGADAALGTTTQLERFITAAMVLGLVAERQGDLFGVLAFDDQVRSFVRARNGKAHYAACRDALYTLTPRRVNPDFAEVCAFVRLRMRRRALLIFLTNLDDPVLAESFTRDLEVLGRHHLVLVNMITAPEVAPLFSDPEVSTTDDLYRRPDGLYRCLGGHLQWQSLRELEQVLRRRGVRMTLVDNELMCPQLVSQYINVKQRQVL